MIAFACFKSKITKQPAGPHGLDSSNGIYNLKLILNVHAENGCASIYDEDIRR